MGAAYHVYLASLLAALAITQGMREHQSIQYIFTNNAKHTNGGQRFDSKIGEDSVKSMMKLATKFIERIFAYDYFPACRVKVKQIHLSIDQMEKTSTYQFNNEIGEIQISANHIASCEDAFLTPYVSDIIYYEMTHILQSKAGGQIPITLRDGIAAYVVLISNYKEPKEWVKFGGGNKWDQSPDVTAQFLKFCSNSNSLFVAQLNAKMKNSYDANYFVELKGKSISAVWKEYKDKCANHA